MPSLKADRKPTIWLLDDPDREKDLAKKNIKNPETLVEYFKVLDAIYSVVNSKALVDSDLEALSESMESRFTVVYQAAGRRLVQLAHYFPEAGAALLKVMNNSKAAVRVRVVQALWTDIPPKEIVDEILELGEKDKSKNVREFTADRKKAIYG